MPSISATAGIVLALYALAALARWRKTLGILTTGLCAFTANAATPNVHRVNISISANGTYSAGSGGITLLGNGQVTLFGAVGVTIGIEQEADSQCTFKFTFTSSTALNPGLTILSVPISGIAAFTAHSPQTGNCGNGATSGGTQLGYGYIDAGLLGAGGTGSVTVDSGIFKFQLDGSHQDNGSGGSGTWTLSGVGEIGLIPTPPPIPGLGSGSYPTVADGPGGSGYPNPSNGVDGGVALVFDGSGASVSSSAQKTIQIVVPIQPGAATYTADASCSNVPADCWIAIPSASGSIAAGSGTILNANVSAPGSSPGVYPANVAIAITPDASQTGESPTPAVLNVPLTAIVGTGVPVLALSQTGLQFQAMSGVSGPTSRSVLVSNQGSGSLSFSASASTSSGGDWLTVSPASGTAIDSAPATVSIQADPTGLAPGVYFGRLDFTGQGVMNAPQSVEVVLTVLAPSATSVPAVSKAVLNFVANGAGNPPPQNVQIASLSNQPVTLTASAFVDETTSWLSVTPSGGTISAKQPLVETLTVNAAGLTPGVHTGSVFFQDTANNTYSASVQLVVAPSTGCAPTQLLPVFTNLADTFLTMSGLPAPLEAQIVDDCGSPLTAGSVVASFSTGDPSVSLIPDGKGQWTGTWMPGTLAGASASVALNASSYAAGLQGSAAISGTVAANATAPQMNIGGVVSAASLGPHAPIAPGSFISIFGTNLASAPTSAPSLPLPTTLAKTQVLLGGQPLPLNFVGPTQINAIVPARAPVNMLQQITVIQNGTYSLPQTLVVAEAQPAAFTQDQSGAGAGVIVVVKPNGTQFLNTSSKPATAGDDLVIYCAGLGAVNPAVPDGMPASSSTLSHTVNPVTVMIAGQPAKVLFSGLAPGFAGLYQVNVTVPSGITPAPDAPVTLSIAGQISPAVTVAIE